MGKKQNLKSLLEELRSVQSGGPFNVDKKMLTQIQKLIDELNYRVPKDITHFFTYIENPGGQCCAFELCPNCGAAIPHRYQKYCSSCGQKLNWVSLKKLRPNK